MIHPVVLYHGETPWTTPLELTGQHGSAITNLHGATTDPFVTDLVYRLVDLRTIEPERLRVATRTLAYLITLRHVLRPFNPPVARMILRTIMNRSIEPTIRERLLKYLVDNTQDENTDTLLTEWERAGYTTRGGDIMTMAQELMRRGEVLGREEGREEATHDVARRMLEKGATVDFVVETTGLTAEQVSALLNGENKKRSSPG